MKPIKLILTLAILWNAAGVSQAQKEVVKDTITVQGVCDQCKARIEEAAYTKGVKFVEWDKHTQKLVIAYRTDKVTLHEIEEQIAQKGHNTEHMKANREDYDALPACCRYEHNHTH